MLSILHLLSSFGIGFFGMQLLLGFQVMLINPSLGLIISTIVLLVVLFIQKRRYQKE